MSENNPVVARLVDTTGKIICDIRPSGKILPPPTAIETLDKRLDALSQTIRDIGRLVCKERDDA